MDIVIIGSYIVALVMDTDRIPLKGETLMGRNFRQTFGGKGSNQAVQAARLGANVAFAGMIGNDSYGNDFLQLCSREKIDTTHVKKHPVLPTASGFIICGGGHNIITIDIGALNGVDEPYIDSVIEKCRKNSIILLQQEIPLKSALYAARKAHECGIKVILNPAPAFNISHENLSYVDIITPNETEARVCLGLPPSDNTPDEEIAEQLLKLGCRNVVITLGDKGCLVAGQCTTTRVKPWKIDKAVDSTGAGDSFNAALAVALSEGKSITEAALFANAAAALSSSCCFKSRQSLSSRSTTTMTRQSAGNHSA